MRILKLAAQVVFYLAILALLVSSSVSAGISHDENQFIAPGQLLAYHGLFPYVDYPYTHMPYGAAPYAVSAWASDHDFLAGRLMSCLAWLASILLMVAIARALRAGTGTAGREPPSWLRLLWEFLLVYVFVNHPLMLFILSTALNHSLATLFSLLAAWFLVQGILEPSRSYRAAFQSGVFIAIAGLTRFNYASLGLVLFAAWLIYARGLRLAHPGKVLGRYLGGGLVASLPAMVLAVLAPQAFYYGNLVYIRLNTVYYQGLLRKSGMDLVTKFAEFVSFTAARPLDMLLYAVLLYTAGAALLQMWRQKSRLEPGRLGIAAIAVALWLTAFTPTPALLQYFAAPLPFIFLLLAAFEVNLGRFQRWGQAIGSLALLVAALTGIRLRNPMNDLMVLSDPSTWPPVQLHEFAVSLREHVVGGRILTLQPMIPMEAGYEVYPFTSNAPFSWRTSLLLTAQRRLEYGVTSPEELRAVLRQTPPDAILVGFEAPHAGFERQELGGLETPFSDYAREHGYEPVALTTPFWTRGFTLWVNRP